MSFVSVRDTHSILEQNHYLGPCKRGAFAWLDGQGCLVFSRPASRHIPGGWLELSRWCITQGKGSEQWAALMAAWRASPPDPATTILSYSDPAQGHTGALYRACNWLWAPTWHRLRPPPTGNGRWAAGKTEAVKDRWIFPLAPDTHREAVLAVKDTGALKRYPRAQYKEPIWNRKGFRPHTGGGDYKQFVSVMANDEVDIFA